MPFDAVGVATGVAKESRTIWGRGEKARNRRLPPCDVIQLANPQKQLLPAE